MRVDSKGNLYSSGPGGVWIMSPEGKHLGTIRMPERFASFGFGDSDYKTLYVGGRTTIYKIPMKVEDKHLYVLVRRIVNSEPLFHYRNRTFYGIMQRSVGCMRSTTRRIGANFRIRQR
jgi:hypothetical protein